MRERDGDRDCRFTARVGHAGGGIPRSSSARQSGLSCRRQPARLADRLDQERAAAEHRLPAADPSRPARIARVPSGGRRRRRSLHVRGVFEPRCRSQLYHRQGLRQSLGAGRSSTTVRVYVRASVQVAALPPSASTSEPRCRSQLYHRPRLRPSLGAGRSSTTVRVYVAALPH